jgi:predicted hotdog family 3-hydroxylacyl-ACP dehydratase
LHGALCASADARPRGPGFLASARDVRLACWRLDDLPPANPDLLIVSAQLQAADAARILYAFRVRHGGHELASGRIAVVLDVALAGST